MTRVGQAILSGLHSQKQRAWGELSTGQAVSGLLLFPGMVNKHVLAISMQAAGASGIGGYQPIACTCYNKQQEQPWVTGGLWEGVRAHQQPSNIHVSLF